MPQRKDLPALHPADAELLCRVARVLETNDNPRLRTLLLDVKWRLDHVAGANVSKPENGTATRTNESGESFFKQWERVIKESGK